MSLLLLFLPLCLIADFQAANDAQHTAGALNVMAEILLAEGRTEPRKKHKQVALKSAQETLLEAEDVLETHGMVTTYSHGPGVI